MTAPCEIWRDFFYVSIPYQKKSTAKSTGVPNKGPENKIHDPLHGPFLGHANFTNKNPRQTSRPPPRKNSRAEVDPNKNFTPKIHAKLHSKIHAKFHAPKRRRDMLPGQKMFLEICPQGKLEFDVAVAPLCRSAIACNSQGRSAHS